VDIASSYVDEGGEPREFPYMVAWRDGTMVVFDRAGDQKPAHGAVRVCEAVPAVSIERKEALADDVLPKVHAGDKISISLVRHEPDRMRERRGRPKKLQTVLSLEKGRGSD
jgi:hypothetical protein